jgi:drug/metabolite transporter (DMT)-like permease
MRQRHLAAGRLRLTRRVAATSQPAAVRTSGGFALYTLGARHDIAVTAVLVSLFGAVAAILARLVFEERLARVQTAGIATIVAGISTLSLLGS